MEYQYKIRPHHGMCIAFFQGKGYSSEFTVHMEKMIQKLSHNPIICITAQTDSICTKCPNNNNGICETADKVMEYDKRVLAKCGLQEGTVMPYQDFKRLVHERILQPSKREEICGNCEWNELCLTYDR